MSRHLRHQATNTGVEHPPAQLVIAALQTNETLQEVPRTNEIIVVAWKYSFAISALTFAAVLIARWLGFVEVAFFIGGVGAMVFSIVSWLTLRCLIPGNVVQRLVVTFGLGISSAVMAAGYSGLSINAEAAEGKAWFGVFKFGQPDYLVLIIGAVLFAAVLWVVVRLQENAGWKGLRP